MNILVIITLNHTNVWKNNNLINLSFFENNDFWV